MEFKKACEDFLQTLNQNDEESKTGEPSTPVEIDNEFFATLGATGLSVLHAACSQNNIEITEYLLNKRRVNPNLKGKDDWTPLEIAI